MHSTMIRLRVDFLYQITRMCISMMITRMFTPKPLVISLNIRHLQQTAAAAFRV